MKNLYAFLLMVIFSVIFTTGSIASDITAKDIYKNTVNSVVMISTPNGTGSGVITDEEGTIITCFHVIDIAEDISVKTSNGKKYKVNGYRYINPAGDIAILTLKTSDKFSPIKINNGNINVGDSIYAISNPKGLDFVFSDGLISRKAKDIQFTAPVSAGSSGGALLNTKGELIGIISSQYSPSKSQNMNFAFPVSVFEHHLSDKKIINTKSLNWIDFLISKATAAQLKQYRYYAYQKGEFPVMYKYFRPNEKNEIVESKKYPFFGILSMYAYLETYDKTLTDDVRKWFTLAILNNQEVELSSYALLLLEVTNMNFDYTDIYFEYLEKYPKTYNTLRSIYSERKSCTKNEKECIKDVYYKMENLFNDMAKKYMHENRGMKDD